MSHDPPPPGPGQDPEDQSSQAPPPPPPSEPQWNPQSGSGQQGYGQQGYGQQPPSYPPPPPSAPAGHGQPPSVSILAITSLALGVVGLLLLCFCGLGALLGIGAIITGSLAVRKINSSNGHETGQGMAIAGIVTGLISVLLLVVFLVLVALGTIDSNINLQPN